jgi:hypothetical protein
MPDLPGTPYVSLGNNPIANIVPAAQCDARVVTAATALSLRRNHQQPWHFHGPHGPHLQCVGVLLNSQVCRQDKHIPGPRQVSGLGPGQLSDWDLKAV